MPSGKGFVLLFWNRKSVACLSSDVSVLGKRKKKEMTAAALFCGGSVRIATNDKEQDVPPPRPPEGANFCESK